MELCWILFLIFDIFYMTDCARVLKVCHASSPPPPPPQPRTVLFVRRSRQLAALSPLET
ncbi:hypothetical protein DNTS_014644 [Danionella cerebrum]|uniref:Uncharacterized protein n=1 Tax=Danionella cerebrum TaxID=2873325 RepID=A0A553R8K5_9TELE|nr:hypothetical protein DNTS_014644 [Danionella translucida]